MYNFENFNKTDMSKILLKNIVCGGAVCDILIENERISRISVSDGQGDISVGECADMEIADCTGRTAVPGFVNMHTHAGMAMMRGIGFISSLEAWQDERLMRTDKVIATDTKKQIILFI